MFIGLKRDLLPFKYYYILILSFSSTTVPEKVVSPRLTAFPGSIICHIQFGKGNTLDGRNKQGNIRENMICVGLSFSEGKHNHRSLQVRRCACEYEVGIQHRLKELSS